VSELMVLPGFRAEAMPAQAIPELLAGRHADIAQAPGVVLDA